MDSLIFTLIGMAGLLLLLPIVALVLSLNQRATLGRLERQLESLQQRQNRLETELATRPDRTADNNEAPVESKPEPVVTEPPVSGSHKVETPAAATTDQAAPEQEPETSVAAAAITDAKPDQKPLQRPTRGKGPVDHFEDGLRRISDFVTGYFTDGNLFVRIGLLILFFGVAFLLKFAAENSSIPIEFRFLGAAAGGLGLLGFGWYLRAHKPIYALLLQGGGIGVTYITIFAAYRLADLLPSVLTFTLLVFFSGFTVALALLQNSRALAIFALIGGFLSPFLASSGSGNFVGLFSYYAVLNAAVFAVAWFRAWRSLNLLGFAFTFGVFVLWVAFDYSNNDLIPAMGFLLLFFIMYSLIGVLYALRQPEHLTGMVDGSLVFGTPVIVSGLMMVMLRQYDYGIAGASAALGIYYVLLARYAWQRVGEEFRLMAEAMLAIGVVFATLAIPYALDGHWSSAAWALEAAGILWVSIRQKRFYAQCFAILLQVASGVLFFFRNIDDVGQSLWMNPSFLGGVFIALGAFISARMLYQQSSDFRLRLLHIPFFIWAMGWWLVSVLIQIDEYHLNEISASLVLFTSTALVLVYLDRIRQWNWMPAAISASLLPLVLAILALATLDNHRHVLISPDLFFWLPAIAASYWMIEKMETVAWPAWVNLLQHTVFVVFAALLVSVELLWFSERHLSAQGEGFIALLVAGPLFAIYASQKGLLPAVQRLGEPLQLSIIGSLSIFIIFWSLLVNLSNSGDPSPLPYLPFLNPVDLAHMVFFILVVACLPLCESTGRIERQQILVILSALGFVWLTAILMRSLHHYLQIPFDLSSMSVDTRVQTAISILWTFIGMGAMLFASRRHYRMMWIVGAALVAVVLVKMFFVDLRANGTVERIVSFLVVGSLLVATGYFSPIPQKNDDQQEMENA
ncbi:MAG: DUF2339 domain-containing protein [Pseudomonadota bacterium]